MNTAKINILDEWNRRATRAGWAQNQAAALYGIGHHSLGIPLVICTAIVGALANDSSKATVIAPLSIVRKTGSGLALCIFSF